MTYDFGGWATKNDLKCSDGRTICKDAFKDCDGKTVPLIWSHQHDTPFAVLGHALLKNQNDGVYAYCSFNDTEAGRNAKLLVEHGDVCALSIFANKLKQIGSNVVHGAIKEVSLVLAGANPGAFIDFVMAHGEENDDAAVIYTGEPLTLRHSDDNETKTPDDKKPEQSKKTEKSKDDETVGEVFNTLDEKQKDVVYALIAEAIKEGDENIPEEGEDEMKHNVFDKEEQKKKKTLSHDDLQAIIADGKRYGSLRESFMAHVQDLGLENDESVESVDYLAHAQDYGIENIGYLFPDAKNVTTTPQFIQREMGWVQKVMSAVHHSPFSRIKSIFADITEDEARARGYIKGKKKKDEVFSLLKRTTMPTTVYKKQKMDRDDIVDITDFSVAVWLKSEMRMMLDEELARGFLIGDGRLASSDDKINEQNIRPIATDDDLFTIKVVVGVTASSTEDEKARKFIAAAIKARKDYKGSGSPSLYTTEDMLTSCLLLTDTTGRDLYTDENQLAKKLRVKEIITVPVMEGAKGKNGGDLLGVIVNLADYNVGADKGGSVNMFEDFDIDYNAEKYLIETRCSGALVKPHSAIALETPAFGASDTQDTSGSGQSE